MIKSAAFTLSRLPDEDRRGSHRKGAATKAAAPFLSFVLSVRSRVCVRHILAYPMDMVTMSEVTELPLASVTTQ